MSGYFVHNDVAATTPPTAAPRDRSRWARRAGAGLLTAALGLTGLAGLLPADVAAAADEAATNSAVMPVPQEASDQGIPIDLTGRVTIVAPQDVDKPALANLKDTISEAGGTVTIAQSPPGSGTVIYLGQGATVDPTLAELGVPGTKDLPAEGYVLTSGKIGDADVLVLAGADARGTYYATTTLEQLASDGLVPARTIRDYPMMPIRGTIEGFYGIPWSHQARMDLLAFSGEHKLNTYIYTPKDDPLLRENWRELYSGEALDQLAELVEQANEHHVDFTYALSPGNSICYSSDADFQATIDKFEQLRELGVTSFYIALDDIGLQFHCDADREKYPDTGDWHWLADAQADYLNRIQR